MHWRTYNRLLARFARFDSIVVAEHSAKKLSIGLTYGVEFAPICPAAMNPWAVAICWRALIPARAKTALAHGSLLAARLVPGNAFIGPSPHCDDTSKRRAQMEYCSGVSVCFEQKYFRV